MLGLVSFNDGMIAINTNNKVSSPACFQKDKDSIRPVNQQGWRCKLVASKQTTHFERFYQIWQCLELKGKIQCDLNAVNKCVDF